MRKTLAEKIWFYFYVHSCVCTVKCLTEQLQFQFLHTAPPGGGTQDHTALLSYMLVTEDHIGIYTCRGLSPTTGPLPTAHCWQSTMHCPDSAKWGKSCCVSVGGPLKYEFIFGQQKQLCDYLISESTTMFVKTKNNVMICKTL